MTPFALADAMLIVPFRLLPWPEAGFYFGVLVLAIVSALLGRACSALVAYAHRSRRQQVEGETKHRADMSVEAAQRGNKEAYLVQNTLAQEAYGSSMALAAGRAAALLWPGMMTLAWLAWRFEGVPMPGLWESAGPVTAFLPPFIAALWAQSRLWKAKAPASPASH